VGIHSICGKSVGMTWTGEKTPLARSLACFFAACCPTASGHALGLHFPGGFQGGRDKKIKVESMGRKVPDHSTRRGREGKRAQE